MRIKIDCPEVMPERQHWNDAGLDLKAAHDQLILPGHAATIDTGIAVEIPSGWVGLVFSRSGLGKPSVRISLTNSVGVIDAQYRGKIKANVQNDSLTEWRISKGERFCQLVIVPVHLCELEVVDELEESDRGTAGFGSTGT